MNAAVVRFWAGMIGCVAAWLASCARTVEPDSKKALESLIQKESGGAVVLKRFSALDEKRGVEDGRSYIRAQYKAEIEFMTAGVWRFYPADGKLSFQVDVPPDFAGGQGGNIAKMVTESKWYEQHRGATMKAGERTTVIGYLTFAASSDGWRVVTNQFDISYEPWILPSDLGTAPGIGSSTLGSEQQKRIMTNLKDLSYGAEFYYLETGRATVTFTELVRSNRTLAHVKSVVGEDYNSIKFELGKPISVSTPQGETLTCEAPRLR